MFFPGSGVSLRSVNPTHTRACVCVCVYTVGTVLFCLLKPSSPPPPPADRSSLIGGEQSLRLHLLHHLLHLFFFFLVFFCLHPDRKVVNIFLIKTSQISLIFLIHHLLFTVIVFEGSLANIYLFLGFFFFTFRNISMIFDYFIFKCFFLHTLFNIFVLEFNETLGSYLENNNI